MRARQPLDIVLIQHNVQGAAGATVGVRDEDALVLTLQLGQLRVDRAGDLLRGRVELGRQAAHVDVRPAVEPDHREHLAGDRAAREDEHVGTLGRAERDLRLEQLGGLCVTLYTFAAARRASTSACAVSAATAASRQYASAPIAVPNSSFSGAPPTSTM